MRIRTTHELGAALRARRQVTGRTQAAVAQAVGVSRTWLSLVENGGSPGAEIGLVLAVVAELDLDLTLAEPGAVAPVPAGRVDVDLDAIIEAHGARG